MKHLSTNRIFGGSYWGCDSTYHARGAARIIHGPSQTMHDLTTFHPPIQFVETFRDLRIGFMRIRMREILNLK